MLPNDIIIFELSTFELAKENVDIHLILVEYKEFKLNHIAYVIDTKSIWKGN